VQLSNLSFFR